jgi:hypothetical protein
MTQTTLEKRVIALEQQMAELRATVENGRPAKNWEKTVGMFTGDEVMKRIDEHARRYREADRAKVRGRRSKKARSSR